MPGFSLIFETSPPWAKTAAALAAAWSRAAALASAESVCQSSRLKAAIVITTTHAVEATTVKRSR
jgi:hypothetical protein